MAGQMAHTHRAGYGGEDRQHRASDTKASRAVCAEVLSALHHDMLDNDCRRNSVCSSKAEIKNRTALAYVRFFFVPLRRF